MYTTPLRITWNSQSRTIWSSQLKPPNSQKVSSTASLNVPVIRSKPVLTFVYSCDLAYLSGSYTSSSPSGASGLRADRFRRLETTPSRYSTMTATRMMTKKTFMAPLRYAE